MLPACDLNANFFQARRVHGSGLTGRRLTEPLVKIIKAAQRRAKTRHKPLLAQADNQEWLEGKPVVPHGTDKA
jgi:hypothetical protein